MVDLQTGSSSRIEFEVKAFLWMDRQTLITKIFDWVLKLRFPKLCLNMIVVVVFVQLHLHSNGAIQTHI